MIHKKFLPPPQNVNKLHIFFWHKEGESESCVEEGEGIRWKLKNAAVDNIVFLH